MTHAQPGAEAPAPEQVDRVDVDEPEEQGGAAACDLHRVCDACGALEDGPPQPLCGRCGAERGRSSVL